MAWTFIDMIKTDTLETATEAAARVDDPRMSAFHDPQHQLGRAMARCLGWKQHVAWDTYFIYRAGTHWTGPELPAPEFWFHQLQDREVWERTAEAELGSTEWTQALPEKSEADPAHFATGEALRMALAQAVAKADSRP
jgi:hypothetical protein